MSTMTGSFGAVVQNMSVQRLYEKALDQIMVSPTPLWQFIIGQIIGGSIRGLYAAAMILVLTLPLNTGLIFNAWSLLIMFLNGTVFATIALTLSFMAKSYTDAPRYTSFIIVPMSFLCNTFFLPRICLTGLSILSLHCRFLRRAECLDQYLAERVSVFGELSF